MSEAELHSLLVWAVMATGAAVFVALFFITAPYGRHSREGWGPKVSSRVGWILMESPALYAFVAVYALGAHRLDPAPMALAALWLLHYGNRALVYPFRMRSKPSAMPLGVPAMALVFNTINAYVNARWLSQLGRYDVSWLADPRFMLGAVVFLGGMALNISSDNILFALRKPGEGGYKIPHGGGYRWLSSPNYFGELLEWGGFALAAWSMAALAFFLFTAANLLPRAIANHRWYRQTFADYPKQRKAIIPWLV